MKALITVLMIFSSINCFAKEVGEDKKGDCLAGDQSKRAATKQQSVSSVKLEKPAPKIISK